MQTRNAIGNLLNRYRAVLKKCNFLNTFALLALLSSLNLATPSIASAADITYKDETVVSNPIYTWDNVTYTNSKHEGDVRAFESTLTLDNSIITGSYEGSSGATLTLINNSSIGGKITLDSYDAYISSNTSNLVDIQMSNLFIGSQHGNGELIAKSGSVLSYNMTIIGGTSDASNLNITNNSVGTLVLEGNSTMRELTTLVSTSLDLGKSNASKLVIEEASSINNSNSLVAGQAGQLIIGSSDKNILDRYISDNSSLTFGDNITSAFYLGEALTLTYGNFLLIDGAIVEYNSSNVSYEDKNRTPTYTYDPSNSTTNTKTAIFGANSLFVLDVTGTDAINNYALTTSTITINDNSYLLIANVGAISGTATVYVANATSITDNANNWANADSTIALNYIYTDNAFLSATGVKKSTFNFDVDIKLNTNVDEVLPSIDKNLGNLILEGVLTGNSSDGFSAIKNLTNVFGSKDERNSDILTDLANISVLTGSIGNLKSISKKTENAIQKRTSFFNNSISNNIKEITLINTKELAQAMDNTSYYLAALNSPNYVIAPKAKTEKSITLWGQGGYQKTNAENLSVSNFEYGFNSDTYSLLLGVDYNFLPNLRTGLALNLGTGTTNANSYFDKAENNFQHLGLNLYNSAFFEDIYLSDNIYINNIALALDLDYLLINNNSSVAIDAIDINAEDYLSHKLSLGLRGENIYSNQYANFVRYAGLRLNHYRVDEFYSTYNGSNVFKSDTLSATNLTLPIGFTVTEKFSPSENTVIMPTLGLGLETLIASKYIDQQIRLDGVDGSANLQAQAFERFNFQLDLGLDVKHKNMKFFANYGLNHASDITSHNIDAHIQYYF